jgi:hypothetical protein
LLLENIQKWGLEGVAVNDFTAVLSEFLQFEPHLHGQGPKPAMKNRKNSILY